MVTSSGLEAAHPWRKSVSWRVRNTKAALEGRLRDLRGCAIQEPPELYQRYQNREVSVAPATGCCLTIAGGYRRSAGKSTVIAGKEKGRA